MTRLQRLGRFLTDTAVPWIGAVAVHGLLLAALTFSLGFDRRVAASAPGPSADEVEVIEALVIDAASLKSEVDRRAAMERDREEAAARARREAEAQRRAREQEQARLAAQREREAAQAAEREREAKRLAQLQAEEAEARAAAAAAEAKRQAAEEAERLRQEKLAAEEAERLAREEAERKRREEAERKRREEAERLAREKREREQREQAEREKLLLAAMAEEEERNRSIRSGLLAQYIEQVRQKVERNWFPPPTASGVSCELTVRQLRDGSVVSVNFGSCDGDSVTRDSIERAVLRASPLPLPPDPSLFEQFVVILLEKET